MEQLASVKLRLEETEVQPSESPGEFARIGHVVV